MSFISSAGCNAQQSVYMQIAEARISRSCDAYSIYHLPRELVISFDHFHEMVSNLPEYHQS
jgi:hypothetical protein